MRTSLMFKFRTMRDGVKTAPARYGRRRIDSRVTRVGGFSGSTGLTRYRSSTTLKGDMSIVGPRPERLEFVNKLKEQIPYYSERHS